MNLHIDDAWNPSLCLIKYYVLPMDQGTKCHGCKYSKQCYYHKGWKTHNHVLYNEDERMSTYAHFLNSCYKERGSVGLSFVHLRRDHGLWWSIRVDDTSSKRGWFKDGSKAMGLPSTLMTRLTEAKLVIWSMGVISTCTRVYWTMKMIPFHKNCFKSKNF